MASYEMAKNVAQSRADQTGKTYCVYQARNHAWLVDSKEWLYAGSEAEGLPRLGGVRAVEFYYPKVATNHTTHAAAVVTIEDVYPACGHIVKFDVNMRRLPAHFEGQQCLSEEHLPLEARRRIPFHDRKSPLEVGTTQPIYGVTISLTTDSVFAPEFLITWEVRA